MRQKTHGKSKCAISGVVYPASDLTPLELLRRSLAERIRKDYPALPADALISRQEANRYRTAYVEELPFAERGELSNLEQQVARSLVEAELISANIEKDYVTPAQLLGARLGQPGQFRRQLAFPHLLCPGPDRLDSVQHDRS